MHGHSSHEAQRLTGDQHKVWLLKNPADVSQTDTNMHAKKHTHSRIPFPRHLLGRSVTNSLLPSQETNTLARPQNSYSGVVSPWNMWRKRKLIRTLTVTAPLMHPTIMGLRGQRGLRKTKDGQCSLKTPNKDTCCELLLAHLSRHVGMCA